jgi:NDP-sugar pyrophosphorylase family protein
VPRSTPLARRDRGMMQPVAPSSSENVRAVIVAGGRGTRLAPYTTVLPKPLMPLEDRPILDVVLTQLANAGIRQITISVGYLGGLLESWVRHAVDGRLPVRVEFLYEDEPLGTAGALANLEGVEDTIIAMNGDILTTLLPTDLLAAHRASGAVATVAMNVRTVPIEYGVLEVTERDGAMFLTGLREKPKLEVTVSMGVYAFEPVVLEYLERGARADFPDLLQRLIDDGRPVGCHRFDGYWRDIGNREDYGQAVEDFAADPDRFLGSRGS